VQIQGEVFFLINGWMNFLSLALAAHLARRPFSILRAIWAALLLSVYALVGIAGAPVWRSLPALLAGAFAMAAIAFGRFSWRLGLTVFLGGLLLGGETDFFLGRGMRPGWALALGGILTALTCRLLRLHLPRKRKEFLLEIALNGKHLLIPGIRDSGNRLKDYVRGLPVIVVPYQIAKDLLPQNAAPSDLSTLPQGWYLVGVETAAGKRLMMCMRPDRAALTCGTERYEIAAAVAIADFSGKWALLPDELFWQEEDKPYASL